MKKKKNKEPVYMYSPIDVMLFGDNIPTFSLSSLFKRKKRKNKKRDQDKEQTKSTALYLMKDKKPVQMYSPIDVMLFGNDVPTFSLSSLFKRKNKKRNQHKKRKKSEE